jgi:asparagine synthase (glutamine-hydrolysing)
MCGFAGFLGQSNSSIDSATVLTAMGDAIRHRGPDDAGIWVGQNSSVGFAHRRLAILDLSPAGHQPMESPTGRYTLVFNGEIYNHLELRHELESVKKWQWRGHSDTETIVACFEEFGIEETLYKLIGMFAIAVWDHSTRELLLARDRLGEKPLYFGWCGQTFLFGSELKALQAHPAFDQTLDRTAIAQYMRYSYVPAPRSIFEKIQKLPAGYFAVISLMKIGQIKTNKYWDLAALSESENSELSAEAMIDELHQRIVESVKSQMLSDVPLGAFLSGGVDSSLIVGIMQTISKEPIKTFTIGFEDQAFNEAIFAADVARHIGTEHHELILTAKDTLDVVPKLALMYDEPFADSSQIPTFLVCAMAHEQVTVSLSGDGGDELFAGYSRYPHVAAKWQQQLKIPKMLRSLLAMIGGWINPHYLNWMLAKLSIESSGNNAGLKLSKAIAGLKAKDFKSYYQLFVTHFTEEQSQKIVLDMKENIGTDKKKNCSSHPLEQMMKSDALNYMTDDILVKVDRASMATSLETRVPLLDVRVVEYAFKMPLIHKYGQGVGKLCLRKILDKYVPRELIERPKKGFGVPLGAWLRGELREWGEALIEPDMLKRDGYLNVDLVTKMWKEHQQGVADWHFQLWNILIFQNWLRSQNSGS